MKKFFLVGVLMTVLVLTACGPATQGPITTGETIKIGLIAPLTGDVASLGQDEKATVEMFFAEHPTIAGKKVEVVYEDTQCNGEKAASATQKLVSVDKVVAILGGLCSGETLGAAPIAEKNKVILFSPGSTSPEVTTAGDYVFRNAPSDVTSTDVMSEVLAKKYKKAALITQNNDFSQAYRTALKPKLAAAGVEVVVDETFNTGATDFKTVLQKIKDSGADVLVSAPGEVSPGGFIAKQARELGLDLPIYGPDSLSGKEYFDIAKDAAEGTIIVIAVADNTRSDVQAFLKKLTDKLGHAPATEIYPVLSWDRLSILKQAWETVGFDSEKVKDSLYSMETYKGLGGDTKFDKNGDVNLKPSLMVAKGGKFEIYKE